MVDDDLFLYTPVVNDVYNITGIAYYSFGAFKLLPRLASDISTVTAVIPVENAEFKLYPNPTSAMLNISNAAGLKSVMIYNMSGQIVQKVNNDNQDLMEINVESLPGGLYFIRFEGTAKVYSATFMKN